RDKAFVIKRDVLAYDLTRVHYVDARSAGNNCFQLFVVAKHSPAIFEDELLHVGVAHRELIDTRPFNMSANRPKLRPSRFFSSEISPWNSAHLDYLRNGCKGLDVIDHRRTCI